MDIANFKLRIAKVKFFQFSFCILPFALLVLSGCVAFQVGGEVERGRAQLMFGDPKIALTHFQRAAELDPAYRYDFSILDQGIWTYVGRAHYVSGRLPEARQALERALSRYGQDHMARLYLGMVLARDGDRQRGLKEIGGALTGLGDWFDHLDRYHPDAHYWDPGKQTRAEIQRGLAMVSGKEPNLQELIARGEWLGKVMEEEIDLAERQKRFEETRASDDDSDPN